MKTATLLAVVFVTVTSIPLLAQQASANAQQNAAANAAGAQAAAGFGDEAASHAWEMSSVNGELQGKLDSKTAKAGDRVVLKTMQKVVTPDGTVIPKGSRLVGHVTQAQARDAAHSASQLAIAFDRAELKNGQNIAIHTLIRGVSPNPSAMAMSSENDDAGLDAPMGGGGMGSGGMAGGGMAGGGQAMGGSRSGGGGGGLLGGAGRTVGGVDNVAGGTLDRTAATTSTLGSGAGAGVAAATDTTVQTAGRGDMGLDDGAHTADAIRAIPHATGIPGVMLAGNSSASGVFSANKGNVHLDSGTEMQLGIVADR